MFLVFTIGHQAHKISFFILHLQVLDRKSKKKERSSKALPVFKISFKIKITLISTPIAHNKLDSLKAHLSIRTHRETDKSISSPFASASRTLRKNSTIRLIKYCKPFSLHLILRRLTLTLSHISFSKYIRTQIVLFPPEKR